MINLYDKVRIILFLFIKRGIENLKSLKSEVAKYSKTSKIKLFAIILKETNNFLMKFSDKDLIEEITQENENLKLIEVENLENVDFNIILKKIIEE